MSLILVIFSLAMTACKEQHSETGASIQATLDHLKIALNEHDFEEIEPLIAVDFAFNGYDGEMGRMIMSQIVAQYPQKTSAINITDVKLEGSNYVVTAEFVSRDETVLKEVILTSDYKIERAQIVEIAMGGHEPAQKSHTIPFYSSPEDNIPSKMVADFELAGRLITVEAEVEGVRGTYIVDSGAVTFMLNSRYFPGLEDRAKPMDHGAQGVNGSLEGIRVVDANNFIWQDTELASISALLYDLSHLEEKTGVEIKGLIGAEFLKRYVVEYDYSKQEITLYSNASNSFTQDEMSHVVDIEMLDNMPVFGIEIGKKKLRVALDCGAEEAMLFKKWDEPLSPYYKYLGTTGLSGADKVESINKQVKLDAYKVGDVTYKKQDFIFADLTYNHSIEIDGLLGYEFLSQHKTTVDYEKGKIYISS